MKLLLSFLLIFSVNLIIAQNNTLLEKIKKHKQQDAARVELLVDYCVENTFSVSDEMLIYAKEAYRIAVKIKYPVGQIRALNCIGNYYYQQGINDKAITYYTEAIRIAEKNHDIENLIICKSNLASIYIQINEPKKALQLFLQSDALLIKTGKSESQNRAALLTNIGAAYSAMGLHEEALQYHVKVLNLCRKKNILFGVAIAQSNIGDEYIQLKQYEKAFPFLTASMVLSEKKGFDSFLGQIYEDLGVVYGVRKDYDKSVAILKKGLQHCTRINDQNNALEINKVLHRVYAEKGDFRNAYQNALQYIVVNDSAKNSEKQKIIAETNTKYETEKKEATIKDLNQKKIISELESNKKNLLIYSIITLFLTLSSIAYFLFSRFRIKKKNELLQNKLAEAQKLLEAEKKVTDSELKALKSQMNPHFIFNALNSIQVQFMYGDKLLANEQLNNFTYLTRQILEVSGKKQIAISDEVDILTKYLELEKLRFQKDFTYTISIAENIDEDYHKIPPMLIQPIVENSLKHGLMHKKGAKTIHVHFDIDQNETHIICTVKDNGIGRTKAAEIKAKNNSEHNSFSTSSIIQRLELLNTELHLKNLLEYQDLKQNEEINGTKTIIRIPL